MSSRSGSRKSIRVVVRCRPPLGHETQTRADAVVVDMDKRMVLANVMVGDKPRTKQFAYDVVLDSSCSQHDVWEAAGVGEFIDSAVGGFHATIFAYGQTGSGKTFTMEGFKYTKDKKGGPPSVDFEKSDPELFGITPRTIQTLYDKMAADTERRYTVKCSYVQIYKEQAYDLLNPQSAVQTDEKGSWDYQVS